MTRRGRLDCFGCRRIAPGSVARCLKCRHHHNAATRRDSLCGTTNTTKLGKRAARARHEQCTAASRAMNARADHCESRELRAGDLLAGRYLLVEPIAAGGMGRVWAARNLMTGAAVAAKVLLPAHAGSTERLTRFRREAEATAALCHRAIVRVFDLVQLDSARGGSLVLIMELLHGNTLAHQNRARGGALGRRHARHRFSPVVRALARARSRNRPPQSQAGEHLSRRRAGRQRMQIVDFGVSKLLWEQSITLDRQIVGTFSYMSPEQTMGSTVDGRTDIFSLGVLLYRCLWGRTPSPILSRGAFPKPDVDLRSRTAAAGAYSSSPLAGHPASARDGRGRAVCDCRRPRGSPAKSRTFLLSGFPFLLINGAPFPCRADGVGSAAVVSRRVVAAVFVAALGVLCVASTAYTRSAGACAYRHQTRVLLGHDKHLVADADRIGASRLAGSRRYSPPSTSARPKQLMKTPAPRHPPRVMRNPGF